MPHRYHGRVVPLTTSKHAGHRLRLYYPVEGCDISAETSLTFTNQAFTQQYNLVTQEESKEFLTQPELLRKKHSHNNA